MKKPSKKQIAAAKAEIETENHIPRTYSVEEERTISENQRRSSLPSEDPEHIHGTMCDGQDGMNSYCERFRCKLFGDKNA